MRPFTFATGIYASGDWESGQLVPAVVIDSLARHTTLPVSPGGVNVPLDSAELFEFPFLFLTGHLAVRFTAAERRNLLRFVDRGGFVFMDDHNHDINGVSTRPLPRSWRGSSARSGSCPTITSCTGPSFIVATDPPPPPTR